MKTDITKCQVGALRALCEPSRLKLLCIIAEKEICACELPIKIKKSQPVVSLHLSTLVKAGLAKVRPEGTKRLYSATHFGRKVLLGIGTWKE